MAASSTSPTKSSQNIQPNTCCISSCITNKYVMITLLVVGILAITLGNIYFDGIPRLAVTISGAIFCALFMLGVIKNSCCSPREETKAQVRQATPTLPPVIAAISRRPNCKSFAKDELEKNPLSQGLLAALKKGNKAVTDQCQTTQAWTIYFKEKNSECRFRMLCTTVEEPHGAPSVYWHAGFVKNQEENINSAWTVQNPTISSIDDLTFILQGTHSFLELADDPLYGRLQIQYT